MFEDLQSKQEQGEAHKWSGKCRHSFKKIDENEVQINSQWLASTPEEVSLMIDVQGKQRPSPFVEVLFWQVCVCGLGAAATVGGGVV